jgi:hypothetical protein
MTYISETRIGGKRASRVTNDSDDFPVRLVYAYIRRVIFTLAVLSFVGVADNAFRHNREGRECAFAEPINLLTQCVHLLLLCFGDVF